MDGVTICRDDRDLHRTDGIATAIFIDRTVGGCRRSFLDDRAVDRHRVVDPPHDRGILDLVIMIVHLLKAPSNGGEDSRKNSTIAVRSNRDHGAIEPRSWGPWRDRGTRSLRGDSATIVPINSTP